jgi:transcriptional regulator with XRE-family HTH domain
VELTGGMGLTGGSNVLILQEMIQKPVGQGPTPRQTRGPGRRFFTKEMAERLKEIRRKAGLTQEEVAMRMGLGYRGGKAFVSLLERGDVADPHVSTLCLYLKACGAMMYEFFDLLNKVEYVLVDTTPIQSAPIDPTQKPKIARATKAQVEKFQKKLQYPINVKPALPERQRKAVEGFKRYRIQVNIVEQAVKEMLEDEATAAIAEQREPPVRYYDYYKYLALARKVLGALRKRKERKPMLQAQAEGWKGPRQMKPNPLLPQSLNPSFASEEVESYAREQQLNAEAAEMVSKLVIAIYEKIAGR